MIDWTAALLLFLFPLAYSPGPGNMVFAANGARFGLWRTLPASAGYHIATWGVTLLIGFGFATGLERLPSVMSLLRWAGAAWLLWLAFGFLRAGAGWRGAGRAPARGAGWCASAVAQSQGLHDHRADVLAVPADRAAGRRALGRGCGALGSRHSSRSTT